MKTQKSEIATVEKKLSSFMIVLTYMKYTVKLARAKLPAKAAGKLIRR